MKGIIPVLLAALGVSCGKWEAGPGSMSERDSAALSQARIALIVLRAVQGDSSPLSEGHYAIYPSNRVLDELEAAQFLASHPKPVSCSSAVIGRYMSIKCLRAPAGASLQIRERLQEEMNVQLEQTLREMNQRSQPIDDQSLISMSGAGESLLFPLGHLKAFFRDFGIRFTYSIVPPDDEARVKGAVAVFTPGPPGNIVSP